MTYRKKLYPRLGEKWRLKMRKRLWKTQKFCRWCQRRFDDPFSYLKGMPMWVAGQLFPTLDHIVALGKGGTNKRSNLCLACEECNNNLRNN